MDAAVFHHNAINQVGNALRAFNLTQADYTAFGDFLNSTQEPGQGHYINFSRANGVPFTPEMWAIYLLTFVRHWNEPAYDVAMNLPTYRVMFTVGGNPASNELLDAAAGALASLARTVGESREELVFSEESALSFYQLAKAVERFGRADIAYNLTMVATNFSTKQSGMREEIVRYGLALAIAANKMHQIVIGRINLAECIATAADTVTERKLEAFDSVETALEFLGFAPKPFQEAAATLLLDVTMQRAYLQSFRPRLYSFLRAEERPNALLQAIGPGEWPERISTLPIGQWREEEGASGNAQFLEMQIDLARLPLESVTRSQSATTDWTSWIIDHPAYRRAVPHNRSFVREADFDGLLLVLTHEITHVLSLIGGVGNALNSLRVAAHDAELKLWFGTPGVNKEIIPSLVAEHGIASLADGHAASLFVAEQVMELTLKAQILQDVWTPWFEGLAVFGEIAADPALDQFRIGHVTNALRNLVDVDPHGAQDRTQFEEEFARLSMDFEARCSAAITRRGPSRLSAYLSTTDVPYFAGYLCIRSVVAAWRATTRRPLTGTDAFNLLLHATRFSTFSAIPNLSLRSDLFAREALSKMRDWTCGLTTLSAAEIDDFITPPPPGAPAFTFGWKGDRLVKRSLDGATKAEALAADARRCLLEALASLTRPEDVERLAEANEITRLVAFESADVLRQHFETESFKASLEKKAARVEGLVILGSLLPIGHAPGRFFLNMDVNAPRSVILTQFLTTEHHRDDRKPSINALGFPIDRAAGEKIASAYNRLKNPRLEVTRVIDLGGFATPDHEFTGTHLLAFSYDDWFEIRGPTQAGDLLLGSNREHRTSFSQMVRSRLYPNPLDRAEIEIIAPGNCGAERTRDWIDRSRSWLIDGEVVELGDWAKHVRALADRIVKSEERRSRQREAARYLVAALVINGPSADDIVEKDFEALTEHAPESREAIITALFKTAQQPSREVAVANAATALAACGIKILSLGLDGWDVRATIP